MTSREWSCQCGAKNGEGSRWCEGCGAVSPRADARVHVVKTQEAGHTPWAPTSTWQPTGERPLTPEQGRAACKIALEYAGKAITREEAERRLSALFGEVPA